MPHENHPPYSLAPRGPCEKGLWAYVVYAYHIIDGKRTPRPHLWSGESHAILNTYQTAMEALKEGFEHVCNHFSNLGLNPMDSKTLVILDETGKKVDNHTLAMP